MFQYGDRHVYGGGIHYNGEERGMNANRPFRDSLPMKGVEGQMRGGPQHIPGLESLQGKLFRKTLLRSGDFSEDPRGQTYLDGVEFLETISLGWGWG